MPEDSKEDLPGTIRRSPAKAQRTFEKTLDSAHDEYDSEERAHRTAYASLKHNFEKVGDHWEPKDELYERAKKLDVEGRSKMSKQELAQAIARKQD